MFQSKQRLGSFNEHLLQEEELDLINNIPVLKKAKTAGNELTVNNSM